MNKLIEILITLIKPVLSSHWSADLAFALARFICGSLLAIDFGASKFGMPWTDPEKGLSLFQVAEWFPEDVAAFGFPFNIAPVFFAWMAAASEAIGGIFLALGLKTRVFSALLICTMLVAILFQKWDAGVWGKLPAMGFLWIAMYNLVLGSGRFGLDNLLYQRLSRNS